MPDALSKTVPIWVCVLNRLLFPDAQETHILQTPKNAVSPSEYSQIDKRIPDFVRDFKALDLDISSYRSRLRNKPMEVVWVTPDGIIPSDTPKNDTRNVIILCTASGQTSLGPQDNVKYVQGAADDSESWAHGLTASSFWANTDVLLSGSEDDLPHLIRSIVTNSSIQKDGYALPTLVKPTESISICSNAQLEVFCPDFDVVIHCCDTPTSILPSRIKNKYIHLRCATGKVGSRQLRTELAKLDHLLLR